MVTWRLDGTHARAHPSFEISTHTGFTGNTLTSPRRATSGRRSAQQPARIVPTRCNTDVVPTDALLEQNAATSELYNQAADPQQISICQYV